MPKRSVSPLRAMWAESAAALLPPPRLTVSQWADAHRVLDNSSPAPGPWRTSRTPFLREVMDSLSPTCPVERVVLMKSAQCGGTEVLLNFCGYLMHHTPAPAMLVQPSVEMAKRFSKQRLDGLIESSPALRGKVKDPRARDSGNTILMKEFSGGVLILTGANSAVGLRSLPARFVLADELDGWPLDADGEGDPFTLAVKRTIAFGSQRKIFAVSTPTVADFSRIESLYKASDQRKFFVPCLRCQHFQVLTWDRVKWDEGKPETARYICEGCGEAIANHEKGDMLDRGQWRATAPGDGRTRGYHISALYSPPGWPSWGELAMEFLEAKRTPETLQVFVNTILGETWKDKSAQPLEADVLFARREPFAAEVPAGGALLTCGVDVQDDRLELEIVAWGRDEESWSIAYNVLHGDPAAPDVWSELDRLLNRTYRHESNLPLSIAATCIDSGGHHSGEVYEYCRPRLARKVYAIKGAPGWGKPIWPRKATKGLRNAPLFVISADSAKERVYSRLRVPEPGPGFVHIPADRPRDWCEQVVSERIQTRYRNGHAERFWFKPNGVRNEALDVRGYATAALHALYMGGLRLNEHADAFARMADGREVVEQPSVIRSKWMGGR